MAFVGFMNFGAKSIHLCNSATSSDCCCRPKKWSRVFLVLTRAEHAVQRTRKGYKSFDRRRDCPCRVNWISFWTYFITLSGVNCNNSVQTATVFIPKCWICIPMGFPNSPVDFPQVVKILLVILCFKQNIYSRE